MKQTTIALLVIPLLLLAACSPRLDGSYTSTFTSFGGQQAQRHMDFNAAGSVVWTSMYNQRTRGTYVIQGTKVTLTFPNEKVELVREGDVLMRGNERYLRR